MPNKISKADTPLTEFSTERAFTHLREITKRPHYVGSTEHKTVQQYIVGQLEELGLKTEIQQQVGINSKWRAGTTAQNILARIKGTDNTKALLLLSHYDSSPHSSLGASDAGSGVVTILEGLRAFLAKNEKPKNDIIILISDAEELGLLGADAFVKHHPWAKDVGLVLNFEARGSGGPSYMLMETNGGNMNLIKKFSQAKPRYPVATSLMYSVYKMLPNDTDLTVFREDGNIDGYNFAFIDDHFDYHTAQDTPERLDATSLEHQGTYLMPLLTYFAQADLNTLKSDTEFVYFNLPVLGMVYYPFSWMLPLLIAVIVLFIALLIYGLSHHKINAKHVFKGFIPFLLSLLIPGLLAIYGWKALTKIHPQYDDILQGFTYNGHLYIAGYVAITLAFSFLIYAKYSKNIRAIDLVIAPLFTWILINVLVVFYLKGAGYFIITGFYGILMMTMALFSKKSLRHKQFLLTLLAIPLIFLFVPMIQMFPIGLGLKAMVISTSFIVLLFGLLIPVFSLYRNSKKLGYLFLVLGLVIFVSASFKANYNANRKKPNSIIYLKDADKNVAHWASYERKSDGFTLQFLGKKPSKGNVDSSAFFSKYKSKIKLYKETNVKNIPDPEFEINYDTIINDNRNISITIAPQRRVSRIELVANNNINFKRFNANGAEFAKSADSDFVLTTTKGRKKILSYYITNDEDLNIWFSIPKDETPKMTMYEVSYDLLKSPYFNAKPLYHISPRTDIMIPKPFVINDAIIIKKRIDLSEE